jgi:uncharacterized protein YpmB
MIIIIIIIIIVIIIKNNYNYKNKNKETSDGLSMTAFPAAIAEQSGGMHV